MDAQEEVKKLGLRIQRLRLEKGIEKSELAEVIQQDIDYIDRIEAGTSDFTVTDVWFIAKKFNVEPSELCRTQPPGK